MAADFVRTGRRPMIIGVLLALATVFFVWGAVAERSGHHNEGKSHQTTMAETSGNGETGAERTGESTTTTASESGGESEYRPFGINLESTPLITIAAIVSFALAALVALRPHRAVLITVVIVAAGFTALEIAEAIHQLDGDETGLFVLAVLAGLLHAAAAILAARESIPSPSAPAPASVT